MYLQVQALKQAIHLLSSSKITERKNAVKDLSEALDRQEIVEALNIEHSETSKYESSIWSKAFVGAHQALVLEADKDLASQRKKNTSVSTPTIENNRRTFASLVINVLKKANEGGVRVRHSDILSSCFKIFQEQYLCRNFGQHYFNILLNNFLPVREYRNSMNKAEWKELLGCFLKLWDEPGQANVQTYAVLDALRIVVYYGTGQSPLSLQVKREVIRALVKNKTALKNPSLSEGYLKLAYCVCTSVSLECRTSICHLGEIVLSALLDSTDLRLGKRGNVKSVIFELILFQVRCHHPGGALRGSGTAYASDWSTWKKCLSSSFRLMMSEFLCLNNGDQVSPNLMDLGVELCNQIFHSNDQEDVGDSDSFVGPAAKKRRLSYNVQGILDEIYSTVDGRSYWQWLSLISSLIDRYPECLREHDFQTLLSSLVAKMNKCKEPAVMGYIFRCCEALLHAEHSFNSTSDSWLTIWDTALRTVGLNRSELEGHSLLRALIFHGKMPAAGVKTLLKLYKSGTLRRSDDSIKTLIVLCSNYFLPDSVENSQIEEGEGNVAEHEPGMERRLMLDWVLAAEETEAMVSGPTPAVIAEALLPLVVKSQTKSEAVLNKCDKCSKLSRKDLSKVEQNYITASFGGDVLVDVPTRPPTETPDCTNDAEDISPSKLIDRLAKYHLDLIVKKKCEALHLKAEGVIGNDRSGAGHVGYDHSVKIALQLISEATLLFDAMSTLSKHGVITESNWQDWSIWKSVKFIMEDFGKVATKVISFENQQSDSAGANEGNVLNVVTKLKELIENNLKSLGSESLWSVVSKELIVKLLNALRDPRATHDPSDELRIGGERDTFNSDLCNSTSDLDIRFLSKNDQLRVVCVEVLCLFFTSAVMEESLRKYLWTQICEKIKKRNQKLVSTFQAALTCARYAATRMETDDITKDVCDLIQSLCRQWHLDAQASHYIILLLNGIMEHCKEGEAASTLIRKLVVADTTAFLKKEFGPQFTVSLVECLYHIFQLDPESDWARWKLPDCRKELPEIDRQTVQDERLIDEAEEEHIRDGTRSLLEELVFYIGSPLFEVRLAAVRYFALLVADTTTYTQYNWQKTLLARSFCASYTLFSIQKTNSSMEEKMDESVNRTATVIHLLTSIVVSSRSWRKHALRFLTFLVKEKNLSTDLVAKALSLVKKPMHLETVKDLCLDYFDFLLDGWIEKKYDLLEFPFQVFAFKCLEEFLSEMDHRIVPVLFITNKYEIVEALCDKSGRSVKQILERCFAPIVTRAFIIEATAPKGSASERDANRVFNLCFDTFTKEGFGKHMQHHIDGVLENVTKLLWDRGHCVSLLGEIPFLPEMNEKFINQEYYDRTINFLENTYNGDGELIVVLGRSKPKVLQQVLLNLRERVVLGSSSLDRRILALYQYCAFVQKLAPHLKRGDLPDIAEFLVRDVSHTLLHLLRSGTRPFDGEILRIAACRYLQGFYEHILPRCSESVERLLPTLVSVLVPLAQRLESMPLPDEKQSLASCSMHLLHLLLVDHAKELSSTIAQLPSFPKGIIFDDMRQIHVNTKYQGRSFSLEEEIDHFLCSVDVSLGRVGFKCPLEGLQFLRLQLSERKEELQTMYQGLSEIRGFSEECAKSSLHQLICVLARLATESNKKVRLEAACCLGELGMTNLNTLILRPESHHAAALLASSDTTPLSRLVAHAVTLLSNYLFDEDVSVVKSAGKALKPLLSSCEGRQVVAPSTSKKSFKESSEKQDKDVNLLRSVVAPFLAENLYPPVKQIGIDGDAFKRTLDSANVWYPDSRTDHADWIVRLTTSLLHTFSGSCSFLHHLAPFCRIKVAFAEELLPLVLSLVLSSKSETCHRILSARIAQFFHEHTLLASANGNRARASSGGVCMNQASVQCMLNAVHLMRIQQGPKTCLRAPTLKLNYLHVAKAAQFCAAYFSCLMYAEFWFESERSRLEAEGGKSLGGLQSLPPVDYLCDEKSEDGRMLQALLFDAYTRIGDTDAVYGCGSSLILDSSMRMSHCKEMGFWEEILNNTNSTLIRGSNMSATLDLVAALGEGNLLHLQHVYVQSSLRSMSENTAELKPYMLECLWRLGRWDVPLQVQSTEKAGFEWHQFAALRYVHQGNGQGAVEEVEAGRLVVMSQLAHASLESCASIYKPLTKLQALQEIEDAAKAASENGVDFLLLKWKKQDSLGRNDFPYVRQIMEQRSCILQSIMNLPEFSNQLPAIRKVWTDHMLHTVKAANTEGKPQVAKGFLHWLRNVPQQNESTLRKCRLEEAQLEWNAGNGANSFRARLMLRSLLNDLFTIFRGSEMDTILYADVLRLYGTWMAETRIEQPQTIIEKYFVKAIDVLDSLETGSAQNMRVETHACLARFADQQYQRVASYLSSDKFESKKQSIELMQTASKALQKNRISKDDRKALAINHRNSEIDREEVSNVLKQCEFFLDLALKSYAQVLRESDKDNLLAFRLLSLWLNNPTKSVTVAHLLASIPSYKFVPLLCQISAHISYQSEPFADTVSAFIERCAVDHPHHTLPILFALAKSYEDRIHMPGCTEMQKKEQEPRVRGAIHLLEKLQRNANLSTLVKAMDTVFSALISLAYYPVPQTKESGKLSKYSIPAGHKIHGLKRLDYVLLPTVTLAVRSDQQYDNIIGIDKFEDEFSFVGGINAPKKIMCRGTDGVSRAILIKGQDDLRQDAVMQQVFAVMNTLLSTSKETQQRRLKIRTYKVVPLSQRSGIIEWCENTLPLESILSTVHTRYYPKDLDLHKARAKLDAGGKKGAEGRQAAYNSICQQVHPAFRFHFIDNYQTPSVWFERRLAYTQSVATNSMVGYILGLGDRHVHNILMDLNTAEVVHIDFGIAFEQGRILPTPETVPFRLTRDIEDGMGVSGVEGVFRRCCEKTMTVLRRNEGTILAILEVLLYDPLFEWTKTPKKVAMRQLVSNSESSADDSIVSEKSSTEVNAMAERALSRLHQKLQGTEEGSASSIEGQVNRLIQEARDPTNLARLFSGWKPFL